jgi:hypothetical protein
MADAGRVRIELCDVRSFTIAPGAGGAAMVAAPGAEIFLAGDDGRIRRGKPAAVITGESRADVLRRLADWIDGHDDGALEDLAAEYYAASAGR